jgi:hypothetical protein
MARQIFRNVDTFLPQEAPSPEAVVLLSRGRLEAWL